MKLYSKPGACSTADHIVLRWSGLKFDVEIVDADTMRGDAFRALNPTGAVPVLVDGDYVLTQNAAILGYIADSAPAAHLLGDGTARDRAEAARWIAFVNSDLHPAFKPMFMAGRYIEDAAQHDALKASARQRVRETFALADRRLADRDWLAGFRSGADAYLYITLLWAAKTGIDMSGFDRLAAFRARLDADADVREVLSAEGLA